MKEINNKLSDLERYNFQRNFRAVIISVVVFIIVTGINAGLFMLLEGVLAGSLTNRIIIYCLINILTFFGALLPLRFFSLAIEQDYLMIGEANIRQLIIMLQGILERYGKK